MSKRKPVFIKGEHYHIYNRGVDKRQIVKTQADLERFRESMVEFNCVEPTRGIREQRSAKPPGPTRGRGAGCWFRVRVTTHCRHPCFGIQGACHLG